MLMPLARRDQALLLAGLLAGISAAGCNRGADRTPATESSASVTPGRTPSESSMTAPDTDRVTAPDTNRVTAAASGTVKPPPPAEKAQTTHTALPRPSIDPGRKPAKPARPRPATKPAADSAQAAPPSSTTDTATTATPTATAPAGGESQWLKYDAGSNTATFELIAGPFSFNGFSSGGGTLTLPPKANVVMNFVNKDGTPHSAEVISGDGPIPNAAGDPALPRAYTNKALEGLPQEATDVMKFTVPESGTYRIFCGVPGHGLSGMWIWMKVDPAAKAPSFGPTKG